jgi:tetratricopeptide (TPR) repeat protein
VPKILKTDTQRMKEDSAPVARYAGVAVLLAIVIGFAVWSYTASRSHQLFFVNGLDQPYEVQWDGQTLKLGRNGVLPIEVAEGEHALAAPDCGLNPVSISIEANPLTRPFASPVFVVNPDQVAPVVWESTEYTDLPAREEDSYNWELFVGLFHKVKSVNYPFEPFPDTIRAEEGTRTTRTRVGVARDLSFADVYVTLVSAGDETKAQEYLKRRVDLDPENAELLSWFTSLVPEEECLGLLRPKLTKRPVLIEVHRAYQHLMENSRPDHDLAGEYAKYLAAEPDNTALKYLLARARPMPRAECLRLHREACEGEPPCAYAYNALALHHLTQGRPSEALPLATRACELLPGNAAFIKSRRMAHKATGSWTAVLETIERDPQGAPATVDDMADQFSAFAALGKPLKEIQNRARKDLAVWRRDGVEPDTIDAWFAVIRADTAYIQGDLETFYDYAADINPWYSLGIAITQGDLETTIEAFEGIEDPAPSTMLLMYLLADKKGDAQAGEFLASAVEAFRQLGSPFQLTVAACFAGEKPCVPEDLILYGEPLDDMATILTALGVRFPEHQEYFFVRARALNYDLRFPHRFLAEILGPAPAAPDMRVEQSAEEASAG